MRVTFAVAALAGLAFGYDSECWDPAKGLGSLLVKCPDGKALTDWSVYNSCLNSKEFKASYSCNDIPGTAGTLTVRRTGCVNYQDIEYLECAEGEVMQGWEIDNGGCLYENGETTFEVHCRIFDASLTVVTHSTRSTGCKLLTNPYAADDTTLEAITQHSPQCAQGFMYQWDLTRYGCDASEPGYIDLNASKKRRIDFTCRTLTQPDAATTEAARRRRAHRSPAIVGPPTKNPTPSPTDSPTDSPTQTPTPSPTDSPTGSPTQTPTQSPTDSPTGSPTQTPTPSPTESSTDGVIDTLVKLKAFCNVSPANCAVCKGKDQDDGTCKVNPNKISKCITFRGSEVCDRIVGCHSVTNKKRGKKKGKSKCKGWKHGLA